MNWVEMDIYTTTEGIEAVTGSLLWNGYKRLYQGRKDFRTFLMIRMATGII